MDERNVNNIMLIKNVEMSVLKCEEYILLIE